MMAGRIASPFAFSEKRVFARFFTQEVSSLQLSMRKMTLISGHPGRKGFDVDDDGGAHCVTLCCQ
jgi:hypothetical protein